MKRSDLGCSAFLMALGGFTAWQSKKLSLGTIRAPGPGLFPFWLGLLLIGLALLILLKGLREPPAVGEGGPERGRAALAFAALVAYPFALEPVGYIVSTFILMVILIAIMARKAWWFAPSSAALISVVSYLLFKVWLHVLLPAGMVGF